MSIKYMTRVWDTEIPSLPAKMVLLKLADNANDQGHCFPSIKTIAKMCQLSEQGVRNQIRKLVKLGLLKMTVNGGRKSNDFYVLPEPETDPSTPLTPQQAVDPRPTQAVGGTPQRAVYPNRNIPRRQPPLTKEDGNDAAPQRVGSKPSSEAEFNSFIEQYCPNIVNKRQDLYQTLEDAYWHNPDGKIIIDWKSNLMALELKIHRNSL